MTRISVLIATFLVLATSSQANEDDAVFFSASSTPLRRATWNAGAAGSLVFSFKTTQASGLLVYQGGVAESGHSISVGIQSELLALVYSVGNEYVVVPGPGEMKMNDGAWHEVRVDVGGESGFTVDGEKTPATFAAAGGGFQFDGELSLGGAGAGTAPHSVVTDAFGVGFIGCFGGLHVNQEPISVREVASNNPGSMVVAGCPIPDPTGAPSAGCSPDDEDCSDSGSAAATSEPVPSSGKVTIITHKPTTPSPEETTTVATTTQGPTQGPTATEPCDDEDCLEGSATDPPTTPEQTTQLTTEPCDDEDCVDSGSGSADTPTPTETPTETPTPSMADIIKDKTPSPSPVQKTPSPAKPTPASQYTAAFSENSGIDYKPDTPIQTEGLNLQLNFQTQQEEAALMFLGADQSGVLVHITAGKVALSIYDSGAAGAKRRRRSLSDTTFLSEQKINDGNSHDVGATISGQTIHTNVDNVQSETEVNVKLPSSMQTVQVGKAPGQPGFQGSMTDVTVGDVNVVKEALNADDPQYTLTGVAIKKVDPGTSPAPGAVTDPEDTEDPNLGENRAMSGGALAGAIIGSVLGVLLVTALLVFVIIHYQKRDEGSYTLDEESPVKNGSPNNAKVAEGEGKEWYM